MSATGAVAFDTQEALIARAQAKDEAAFAVLVGQYQTAIVNYVYRTMGNRDTEDAHDLAQDTFLKAWKYIGDTQPNLKFGPWVYRIAQRVCLDALRHRKVVRFVPLTPLTFVNQGDMPSGTNIEWEIATATTTTGPDEPEHEALGREVAAEVQRVLDRLPAHYRAALILREYHDLDYGEVAQRLGISRPALKSLLMRARALFLRRYQETHPDAKVTRPKSGPRGGRPRKVGTAAEWGVTFKSDKKSKPWMAQPYDPANRRCHYLGFFATREEAQAVVDAWRAKQLHHSAA